MIPRPTDCPAHPLPVILFCVQTIPMNASTQWTNTCYSFCAGAPYTQPDAIYYGVVVSISQVIKPVIPHMAVVVWITCPWLIWKQVLDKYRISIS